MSYKKLNNVTPTQRHESAENPLKSTTLCIVFPSLTGHMNRWERYKKNLLRKEDLGNFSCRDFCGSAQDKRKVLLNKYSFNSH